jgi:hypothetical protein
MAHVFRRAIAGLFLGPALLLGSFAWWGFLAQRTVFDETRTATIAEELLDNEAVVDQISANIGRSLEAAMPESVPLTDEQVDAGARIILEDPAVRASIISALGTTHRAFLGLDDAPASIDLGPALESARSRIGAVAPSVAESLPEQFVVELPTERIPDASPVGDFLERAVPVLAAIAVVMALLALLTTSDRPKVLGRAARWAIGTTAVYLILGLGVPALLRMAFPDQAEVLAALLTAVLRAAVVPSIVLGVVGAGLLALSMFWPDQRRRPAASPAPTRPAPAPPHSAPRPVPRPTAAPPPRTVAPPPQTPVHRPPAPPTGADATSAVSTGADATSAVSTGADATSAVSTGADATSAMPVARPAAPPSEPPAPPAAFAPPPALPPVAPRPTLPTRAKPPERPGPVSGETVSGETVSGETVSGETVSGETAPAARLPSETVSEPAGRWLPPSWVEGHGWVMDPEDPREPPNNARFVEGVGWVVPGPPPT